MVKCQSFFGINWIDSGEFRLVRLDFNAKATDNSFRMVEMQSFNVLKYHTFVLSNILRIYRIASQNEISVFYKAFSTYYVLITLLFFVTFGMAFVFANLAQFPLALRALTFITGSFQAMCMYYCYAKNSSNTKIIHNKLQAIVDGIVESKRSKKKNK